jgi:hypothetical protein
VACLFGVGSGEVTPITGKTYPTAQQQGVLIRNPNAGNHVVEIDGERVAVLVCHDLAAWSPRGNAVAKGTRAKTWKAMQTATSAERPTLAVHLPHTVDSPATWQAAWGRFDKLAGDQFRSGTSAIRHLDQGWHPPKSSEAAILRGGNQGKQAADVIVKQVDD